VASLANGLSELTKVVTVALEGFHASGSRGTQSIFMYSKHLPCLERTGFELLQYWDKQPWKEIKNGSVIIDTKDPILLLFYEDKTGKVVPKNEIRAVQNTVRSYFQFLWDNNQAPACWGDAPQDLRIDFIHKLEEEYEWLCYCHRHWKSEQIFMNYYPQWYNAKKNPDRKRKRRNDSEEIVDGEENPNGSKHPRLEEVESMPPPIQPASTGVSGGRNRVSLIDCIVLMY
jgi:hypothetical protein